MESLTKQNLENPSEAKQESVNHIDQIASLYELGTSSNAKIAQDHAYNYVVVVLSLISAICLGIICGYLIHIFW